MGQVWHDFIATDFLAVIQSLSDISIATTFRSRLTKLTLFKASKEFRYSGRVEFKARSDAAI